MPRVRSLHILWVLILVALCGATISAPLTLRLEPNMGEEVGESESTFRLGHFYMRSGSYTHQDITTVLLTCFCSPSPHNPDIVLHRVREVNQAFRHLLSVWGMTLADAASVALRSPTLERLSHELNFCSSTGVLNDVGKEILFHAALAVWPWNVYATKNLAWSLEWEGNTLIARSLYKQSFQITGDIGCIFHSAFVSPPLLWNQDQGLSAHLQILSEAHTLISTVVMGTNTHAFYPDFALRELQLAWQYTGVSPGVVSEIYSHVLIHLFPYLSYADSYVVKPRATSTQHTPSLLDKEKPLRKPIRLGIITEHEANSSPGICMSEIFLKLSLLTHIDKNGVETQDFCFVYFRRPDSATTFNKRMEEISQETVTVSHDPGQHEISRELILAQRLDILFYMALPTEKFTIFLSQARLATTQIQFGKHDNNISAAYLCTTLIFPYHKLYLVISKVLGTHLPQDLQRLITLSYRERCS